MSANSKSNNLLVLRTLALCGKAYSQASQSHNWARSDMSCSSLFSVQTLCSMASSRVGSKTCGSASRMPIFLFETSRKTFWRKTCCAMSREDISRNKGTWTSRKWGSCSEMARSTWSRTSRTYQTWIQDGTSSTDLKALSVIQQEELEHASRACLAWSIWITQKNRIISSPSSPHHVTSSTEFTLSSSRSSQTRSSPSASPSPPSTNGTKQTSWPQSLNSNKIVFSNKIQSSKGNWIWSLRSLMLLRCGDSGLASMQCQQWVS